MTTSTPTQTKPTRAAIDAWIAAATAPGATVTLTESYYARHIGRTGTVTKTHPRYLVVAIDFFTMTIDLPALVRDFTEVTDDTLTFARYGRTQSWKINATPAAESKREVFGVTTDGQVRAWFFDRDAADTVYRAEVTLHGGDRVIGWSALWDAEQIAAHPAPAPAELTPTEVATQGLDTSDHGGDDWGSEEWAEYDTARVDVNVELADLAREAAAQLGGVDDDGFWQKLTCTEFDALHAILAAVGHPHADDIRTMHADGDDDEGDLHAEYSTAARAEAEARA